MERLLEQAFGPTVGPWLRRLARGEDDAPLVSRRPVRKSHGCEHTFADVDDPAAVRHAVVDLAQTVARDLRRRHRLAVPVSVTLRFAPFEAHSHGVRTTVPTADAPVLEAAAQRALEHFELGRPVRLAGVHAALEPPCRARLVNLHRSARSPMRLARSVRRFRAAREKGRCSR